MHQAAYPAFCPFHLHLLMRVDEATSAKAVPLKSGRIAMENILGGLAFVGIVAAQLLAVIAVHKGNWYQDCREIKESEPHDICDRTRTRYIWYFGG